MRTFTITSIYDNKPLFSGKFQSFKHCIETAVLENINLNTANLKHLDLSNTNLDNAKLSGANFKGANLTGANLSEAYLQEANFRNATMYNVCLAYSDLSKANLSGAFCGGTDISQTRLDEAIISYTILSKINLKSAASIKNILISINHEEPIRTSKPPTIISGITLSPIIVLDGFFILNHTLYSFAKCKDYKLIKAIEQLNDHTFNEVLALK